MDGHVVAEQAIELPLHVQLDIEVDPRVELQGSVPALERLQGVSGRN